MQAVLGQVGFMIAGERDLVRPFPAPALADRRSGVRSRLDQAMDRYAGGDDAAFSVVYDELERPFLAMARRWANGAGDPLDAVQQAFLAIHLARDRFARGSAVLPWAFSILRRLLIDQTRRRGHEVLAGDPAGEEEASPDPPADETLDRRRRLDRLWRRVRTLKPAWRDVVELRFFEGLSVAETAEALGWTQGQVKINTFRAAAAIRERGGDDGFPTE